MPPFLLEYTDITALSTLRTVAKARYFCEIKTREDALEKLPQIWNWTQIQKLPLLFLGGGSNMLFAFDEFEGVVVRNSIKGFLIDDWKLTLGSGELTTQVASRLFTEFSNPVLIPWVGLPWTIWGGTVGNAGCFWLEWSEVFVSAEVLDMTTGLVSEYSRDMMDYTYRQSVLKKSLHLFICSVILNVSRINTANEFTHLTPKELLEKRREKQPQWFSCGSFFWNPTGHSAGKLIQEAWLKWTTIGGVKISEQHGNFFINFWNGSWRDVIALKELAQKTVRETFGIELSPEVRIIHWNGSLIH